MVSLDPVTKVGVAIGVAIGVAVVVAIGVAMGVAVVVRRDRALSTPSPIYWQQMSPNTEPY